MTHLAAGPGTDADPNPEAALALLRRFAEHVRRGEEVPRPLLVYMAEADERIAAGEEPRRALNLIRPRRRPREPELRGRDFMLAFLVGLAMSDLGAYADTLGGEAEGGFLDYAHAVERVAEDCGVGESVVRRAVKAHQPGLIPRPRSAQ